MIAIEPILLTVDSAEPIDLAVETSDRDGRNEWGAYDDEYYPEFNGGDDE